MSDEINVDAMPLPSPDKVEEILLAVPYGKIGPFLKRLLRLLESQRDICDVYVKEIKSLQEAANLERAKSNSFESRCNNLRDEGHKKDEQIRVLKDQNTKYCHEIDKLRAQLQAKEKAEADARQGEKSNLIDTEKPYDSLRNAVVHLTLLLCKFFHETTGEKPWDVKWFHDAVAHISSDLRTRNLADSLPTDWSPKFGTNASCNKKVE